MRVIVFVFVSVFFPCDVKDDRTDGPLSRSMLTGTFHQLALAGRLLLVDFFSWESRLSMEMIDIVVCGPEIKGPKFR